MKMFFSATWQSRPPDKIYICIFNVISGIVGDLIFWNGLIVSTGIAGLYTKHLYINENSGIVSGLHAMCRFVHNVISGIVGHGPTGLNSRMSPPLAPCPFPITVKPGIVRLCGHTKTTVKPGIVRPPV